jgi:hypothetical protein
MIIFWSNPLRISRNIYQSLVAGFVWRSYGSASAGPITSQNTLKTIGVIGEQDDRFMFDSSTGLA